MTTEAAADRPARTARPVWSLRKVSLWLATWLFALLIALLANLQHTVVGVRHLAAAGGTAAAPKLLEELRAQANIERLILLGDELVAADSPLRWHSAVATIQALAYHPSLAQLSEGASAVRQTHAVATDLALLKGRWAAGDAAEKAALRDRLQLVWLEHREKLRNLADAAAGDVVHRATSTADRLSDTAEHILVTTFVGVLGGIFVALALIWWVRAQLLRPLFVVSEYLSQLSLGLQHRTELPDPTSEEMRAVVDAVARLERAQGELREISLTDRLTGLPNRYALEINFERAMAEARREKQRVAYLFIDLDRFKSINDLHGHITGDDFLKEIARRLGSFGRNSDTLARLGGDEFVAILTHIDDPSDAGRVAQRMIDVISAPLNVGPLHLESSASIGICLFPDDGADSGTVMKKADIAMYAAKKRGRGQYVFSNPQLDSESSERLLIENQLSQALKNREFILHFQPQVDAATEQCQGVEALVRWQRPNGELMPPLRFIPVAEECGLIEPIGDWVLEEACRTLQQWRMHGVGDLTMAVNLSAPQLKPALPARVRELLARHDLPPCVLELEITESVAMRDPQQTIGVLKELESMGIGVAIDDFGTGHSSFAYLKRFPLSRLKIDRTFIEDIEADESDREICTAMIRMAQSLGLRVVAEGVETAGQAEFLRNAGCDDLQGYLYSRPQPADQAEQFVVQRMRLHGGPSARVQKRV